MSKNLPVQDTAKPERWGAKEEDWIHFSITLGLIEDLLPVVSNPHAKISEKSSIKILGKTPSRYNNNGKVIGIQSWTQLKTTDKQIMQWYEEPDYGICLQTRTVRAIDVDVTDSETSNRVSALLEEYLDPNFPKRIRKSSSKFLAIFKFDDTDEFKKQVIKTNHGPIEFLGNGQQFVAAGSHIEKDGISRSRYEWEGGLPMQIPVLSRQRLYELITALEKEIGVVTASISHKSVHTSQLFAIDNKKPHSHLSDPVFIALESEGLIRKEREDGAFDIICPFEELHTMDNSESATTYFPPHTGGYAQSNINCLHSHCESTTQSMFKQKLGITSENECDEKEIIQAAIEAGKERERNNKSGAKIPELDLSQRLPPVMRDILEEYLSSALYSDPELVTAMLISIFGAILSENYCTHHGKTSTAQYFVFTAETGSGKEELQRLTGKLLQAASKSNQMSDLPASSPAFLTMLKRSPCSYIVSDEFGDTLIEIFDPKGNTYKKAISGMLMKLRTKTGDIFYGPDYANESNRERIIVNNPRISLAGFTTPTQFHKALTGDVLASGFLPRILIIESHSRPAHNRNARAFVIPASVTDWCNAIDQRKLKNSDLFSESSSIDKGDDEKNIAPIPEAIPLSADAEELWHDEMVAKDRKMFSMREAGEYGSELLSRRVELAHGIALIFTLARDPLAEEISVDDFRLALDFVSHHQDRFIKYSLPKLGESDFSKLEAAVLDAIRNQFSKKQEAVPMRELVQYCRLFSQANQHQRREVIAALESRDEISVLKGARGGQHFVPK